MPMNEFGNIFSSYDNGIKIDTSIFVQKPYLRTNYLESIIEEDIDLKNTSLKIYLMLYPYGKQLQKFVLILNIMILVQ